jgi:hypothetical protein
MAIEKYPQKTVNIVTSSRLETIEKESIKEKLREDERIRDMLLLLENLVQREETTVKMLLDCLYDIGSVNLINNRITYRPANKVIKFIANMSKPAFRLVGIIWFKKNCPKLIANWLHKKVIF